MSEPTPADHAWAAAESIRALNHATCSPGYEYPADVDRVIAALETLTQRLPQALRQADAWLTRHRDRFGADDGSDPGNVVAELTVLLMAASAQARNLTVTLGEAHQLSAKLYDRG